MTPNGNWADAVEASLRCAHCGETNVAGKKAMVERVSIYLGFCNACGREFPAVRLRG